MPTIDDGELKTLDGLIVNMENTAKEIAKKSPAAQTLCEHIQRQAQIAYKMIEAIQARG